ncbi:FkbM family methyltransferase [Chloroflexus sp.]|uniref:FkbM family methyltransferase n=1 Tax=Chloroflexus sp. TaxID=1904827 RepID=UPI002ADD7F7C|nr:FkbM family methyltransferase [Chloroflexus sp.]
MKRRLWYYLRSTFTILQKIVNWYVCFGLLFRQGETVIKLKNGCQFRVRSLMDVWIIKETCLDRDYETYGTPIQDGWTVVDIGAGLGDFAVSVAYDHPTYRVFAYEPFPDSFRLLKENLALNAIQNVQVFPFAVGASSEEMVLFATGAAVQYSTTSATQAVDSIVVPGRSLDDILNEHPIGVCDFLKIDCEGAEFDILFNASAQALQRIKRICLEYHDGVTQFSHEHLVEYLQQRGFHVQTARNPVHAHLGFLYASQDT